MKGDQADFIARLKLTLPRAWFSDLAPMLDGVLAGFAAGWAGLFALLRLVRLQARLTTTSGRFLDLACVDFFGAGLVRRGGESDAALLSRMRRAMGRLRGTRAGIIDAAWDAGYAATVFEPARPADTGAYGTPGRLVWNVGGGWGSLAMPLECLVTLEAVAAVADPSAEIAAAVPVGGAAWLRISG